MNEDKLTPEEGARKKYGEAVLALAPILYWPGPDHYYLDGKWHRLDEDERKAWHGYIGYTAAYYALVPDEGEGGE